MAHLDYRRASAADLTALEAWLIERALEHDQPTFLLHTAAERLHGNRILRPGLTSLERMVAAARQRAREVTFERMSHLLTPQGKSVLDGVFCISPRKGALRGNGALIEITIDGCF